MSSSWRAAVRRSRRVAKLASVSLPTAPDSHSQCSLAKQARRTSVLSPTEQVAHQLDGAPRGHGACSAVLLTRGVDSGRRAEFPVSTVSEFRHLPRRYRRYRRICRRLKRSRARSHISSTMHVLRRQEVEARLRRIHDLVQGLETEGNSGLLRTLSLSVDPNGISAECIQAADEAMDAAVGAEEYYGAALDLATCLRESLLDPEPAEPEPEEPEVPEPEGPSTKPERSWNLGDLALAALLAHLRRASAGRQSGVD